MALLMRLVRSFPKLRDAWNPRVFVAGTPRTVQAASGGRGEDAEGKMKGEGMSERGNNNSNRSTMEDQQPESFSTGDAKHMIKEMAGGQHAQPLGDAVNNMGDRAREAMRDAWDSAKNTAQTAANSAADVAHHTAHSVKQNAESVRRSMNTKQS